jgi:VIT1/CCC1 family predicted Fe2+/Mn2+ transporter
MATNSPERPLPKPELLLANWHEELDSAELYDYLASIEQDEGHAGLLREMAEQERRHARVMATSLQEFGVRMPAHRRSFKLRALKTIARVLGPRTVYPLIYGAEMTGSADYAAQNEETAALAPDERAHARALGQMSGERGVASRHPERWHRSGGGGTLRASVFGVSDGLVSNLSLVMGFAGAAAESQFVLLAGLSGLLAGAASMAAGEYVSMKAQRELLERQIQLEATELMVSPKEEEAELALIYRAKGLPRIEAERIARRLSEDKEVALDTLVREELGLDPGELGSPIAAATGSFVAFALGALIPVLPYVLGLGDISVGVSLVLSAFALFAVGATLSIFTGRGALFSGARQLVIGAVAAAVTFALGSAVGVTTG